MSRVLNQGIWANWSDNPNELKQSEICRQREYNCLNLKKCDEWMNRPANRNTYVLVALCATNKEGLVGQAGNIIFCSNETIS